MSCCKWYFGKGPTVGATTNSRIFALSKLAFHYSERWFSKPSTSVVPVIRAKPLYCILIIRVLPTKLVVRVTCMLLGDAVYTITPTPQVRTAGMYWVGEEVVCWDKGDIGLGPSPRSKAF